MEIFPGVSGLSPSKEVNKGEIIINNISPIPHTNKSTKRHLWIEECWFRNNWFEAQSRAAVSSEQSCC